ncbi:MAG: transposase [Lachnospiraceae bacterium]|nr:transposase [Lachnospiraceae bacterium]
MEIVGYISKSVVEILDLKVKPNTPVFIGESNIEHIKKRHPYEYDRYFDDISRIINDPDYAGLNPKDSSILFVKLYEVNGEYVRVAVKITPGGKYFAKTLHTLSTCNAERYLEKGTLKRLDTN